MTAAVIANAAAGKQTAQQKILEALTRKWPDVELYGVEGYGGEFLPITLPAPGKGSYLERFSQAMAALTERMPDLLVAVGGDGTAAYAADWLLRKNLSIPMFGIGAGTANVGPIVTERCAEELPELSALTAVKMGAIEALRSDGSHIAYGFNDLVLGNTLLGSVDGRTVTLDAYAMASKGLKQTCECLDSIASASFAISKNGTQLPTRFPTVGQIVASTVERESYYGRAVTGVLCFTPDSPFQAAVYLSTVPIITCRESPEGFDDWLSCGQLLLQPGDELTIRGLASTVCAVADGNPYVLPDGYVRLRYIPNLLSVFIRR